MHDYQYLVDKAAKLEERIKHLPALSERLISDDVMTDCINQLEKAAKDVEDAYDRLLKEANIVYPGGAPIRTPQNVHDTYRNFLRVKKHVLSGAKERSLGAAYPVQHSEELPEDVSQ